MKTLTVNPLLTDEEINNLLGEFLGDEYIDTVVNEDCIVYKENGEILLILKKNVIPHNLITKAYNSFKDAPTPNENRGVAAGPVDISKIRNTNKGKIGHKSKFRYRPILRDGTVSKTNYANVVESNVAGFMDSSARIPYCRQTAFTKENLGKFKDGIGMFQFLDKKFSELVPDRYKAQKDMAEKTSKDFVIPGTSFTTITINENFRTALHTDKGDLKEGFGNLTVIEAGEYEGAVTFFPKYGVGANVRTGDILLMDVHEAHCNTELKIKKRGTKRLSFVCYYRRDMIKCGTEAEEIQRANEIISKRMQNV